jgi:hypothetical protein
LLRQHANAKWRLCYDGSSVLFGSDSCLKMHYTVGGLVTEVMKLLLLEQVQYKVSRKADIRICVINATLITKRF